MAQERTLMEYMRENIPGVYEDRMKELTYRDSTTKHAFRVYGCVPSTESVDSLISRFYTNKGFGVVEDSRFDLEFKSRASNNRVGIIRSNAGIILLVTVNEFEPFTGTTEASR